MTPKILGEIVQTLRDFPITIADSVEGEGRGGSLIDEGTIKRFLEQKFPGHIKDVPPRGFGDMIIVDYDGVTCYPVNIKTSIGGTDNATSKLGFLFAFTDMSYDELPGSINNKKFMAFIKDRKADIPTKDYWYLCVDKKDPSNVMIRGCKQVFNWVENANPANLLQINWKKEKDCDPVVRTYDEAYDVIINGIARCYRKFYDNQPDEWRI